MAIYTSNSGLQDFFASPVLPAHKKYEALRSFFYEKKSAEQVAKEFGYKLSYFYNLTRDFRKSLSEKSPGENIFFLSPKFGRKEKDRDGNVASLITQLRKQYISIPEIKSILDAKNLKVSEKYIWHILNNEGFGKLPRRNKNTASRTIASDTIKAPQSVRLEYISESFSTQNSIGILCLLPYIQKFGIDRIIQSSAYPETESINKISSILSFVALKLSNVRRYSADDLWCMDRGLGLFAGLNVLPKTGWFSSYSSRVTRSMNLSFLRMLHNVWKSNGLLSDTLNLDFSTIPYWGDDSHLENNWSGKRNKALSSILSVIAQDPDSGIIDYTDTSIRHDREPKVVFEVLDFYRKEVSQGEDLKYLVFDSKFTPYENLRKLDDSRIKFITIRRRGKNIVERLENLDKSNWKKTRVINANGKGRVLKIFEEKIVLKEYGKSLRQIAITGHGKIKPALIITNDQEIKPEVLVRKYCRRWIVEKGISEQIDFFHLNRVSSSMVIKVDFDLTMTVFSHNLYRLLAMNLPGYTHNTSTSLFEKFISNGGDIKISCDTIEVRMKKKRNLPTLLTAMEKFQNIVLPWMGNKKMNFCGASSS
jgi:transposase